MIANPPQNTRKQTITELQNRLRTWERRLPQTATACTSTGCDALDAMLPGRGIRRGTLVEWVEDGDASGAGTLALLVGRRFCETERPAILLDFRRQIYPGALSAFGFDLSTLIVVRPDTEREALWACEESLRCKAVAMVWASIDRLPGIAFRRLQLAAEESGGVGFFVRPRAALNEPSWADARLSVTPRPGRGASPRFRVTAAYSRGQTPSGAADIEIDALRGTPHEVFAQNQTHRMSVVS
jgi:protein ImuA